MEQHPIAEYAVQHGLRAAKSLNQRCSLTQSSETKAYSTRRACRDSGATRERMRLIRNVTVRGGLGGEYERITEIRTENEEIEDNS